MKRIIVKVKNWLIVKLGGHIYPGQEIKIHHVDIKPVPLSVIGEYPSDIPEEYLIEYLIRQITKEIYNKRLYEIEHCKNLERNSVKYKMTIFVVEPLEILSGCYINDNKWEVKDDE